MKRHQFVRLIPLALALTVSSCDEGPKIVPSTAPGIGIASGVDKPSQVSYNTSMNFSSSGSLRAILHAGRIQQYDLKRYTWLDSNVKVDFYNRNGLHSTILTSASARIDQNTNNMTAYTGVHIVSDSGTIVDTDSLQWLNKDQTIHSDAPVHIVEPSGRTTDGIGFESDQNLEHYRILHPVIVAPAGTLQTGEQRSVLQPRKPQIPGAGAIEATRPVAPLPDTDHHQSGVGIPEPK